VLEWVGERGVFRLAGLVLGASQEMMGLKTPSIITFFYLVA
jgi:hypothetical protein